jgi:2-polyprenyl-6-hydroxyphenyl methylase/3-demethylubiquinone-9 3-methyltransferase
MNASAQKHGSIIAEEAVHFGRLAADWWNPTGSSAMLHKLNPPRLRHIRATIDAQWGSDPDSLKPLAGKRAVDVGCGAGLLTEPLARMGAAVTGIDAAPENVAVARLHAERQGLAIDYRAGGAEALTGETFDLVTSMEVIEHVADPASFLSTLAACSRPAGS